MVAVSTAIVMLAAAAAAMSWATRLDFDGRWLRISGLHTDYLRTVDLLGFVEARMTTREEELSDEDGTVRHTVAVVTLVGEGGRREVLFERRELDEARRVSQYVSVCCAFANRPAA